MHVQGNADGYAIPVAGPADKENARPEWVAVAQKTVNAVIARPGDAGVIAGVRQAGPEAPYLVAEVALALGVSKSTVYKAVECGALGGFRFGGTRKGTIRIPHGAFVDYVAASAMAAVTKPDPARQRSLVVDVRVAESLTAGAA